MIKYTFYSQINELLNKLSETAYYGIPPEFVRSWGPSNSVNYQRYDRGKPGETINVLANWDMVWITYRGAQLTLKVPNIALKATAPTVALIIAGLFDGDGENPNGRIKESIKKAATGATVNAVMNGSITQER